MQEQIARAMALFMVALLSRQDIYEKRISVRALIFFGMAAVFFRVVFCESGLEFAVKGMVPGLVLMAGSFATKEKIGYGDGMAVLVLGLWCGGAFAFMVCQFAFFSSGVCMCLLLLCKKGRNIAFLPFLLAGMEVWFWLG